MTRTFAIVSSLVFLAGCTSPTTPTLQPVPTGERSASAAVAAVKLVIESDQPTTVRFSDGLATSGKILAGPNQVIEFDAPLPWAVAATAVKDNPGFLACHLYVDGKLVSTFDGVDEFAMCGAVEERTGNDWPAGRHLVSMKAVTPSGAWAGWTSQHTGDSETSDPGDTTIDTSQDDGDVRMLIISEVTSDGATCAITVDGFTMGRDETDGTVGDIATCSATAERPAVDDHLPQPTAS